MVAFENIYAAKTRAASYYLNRLHEINFVLINGGDNTAYALQRFDADFNQIERTIEWLVEESTVDDEIAQLFNNIMVTGRAILTNHVNPARLLALYEQALSIAQRFNNTRAVLDHLCTIVDAQILLGNPEQSYGLLMQVREIAEQTGNKEKLAECLNSLYTLHTDSGQHAMAYTAISEAYEIYRGLNDTKKVADTLASLAVLATNTGEWKQAEIYLRDAYAIANRHQHQSTMISVLQRLGKVYHRLGHYDEAISYVKEALEIATRLGQYNNTINIMMDLAVLYDQIHNFAAAQEYYLQALTASRKNGEHRFQGVILGNIGYSAYMQGNYPTALQYMEESTQVLREQRLMQLVCFSIANIIPVYLHLNMLTKVPAALNEGLELALAQENQQLQIMMLVTAVQVRLAVAKQQGNDITAAVQWAGLIYSSPLAEQENRDELDKLRPQMEKMLGEEQFHELLRQGEQLNLSDVLNDLRDKLQKTDFIAV